MTDMVTYKVLWVDDDKSIINAFSFLAEEYYDITLDVAYNWEQAEEKLRVNFKEYSAIILDANCKLKEKDAQPSEYFLGQVSVRLHRIFGEKHEFIPWYVLSAGTMKSFDVVMALINTEERQQMSSIWGELLYFKDSANNDSVEKLFSKIREISKDKTINKVLFRHADVFKYLGKEEYVDYAKARSYILKMLSALYNPEENLNYVYEGNPIRHVVEYIFRTANEYCLLPDDCFDDEDHVSLLDSSRFMAGMTIRCFDRTNKTSVNCFKRMRPETTPVFSYVDAEVVRDILNFSNSGSHTSKNDPYVIEEDKKEIFFGYVLLLCHIIKAFGRYLESPTDKEAHYSLIDKIDAPAKGESAVVILSDDKTIASISPTCKLNDKFISKKGEIVIVESVAVNSDKAFTQYPLFAKVILQKDTKP